LSPVLTGIAASGFEAGGHGRKPAALARGRARTVGEASAVREVSDGRDGGLRRVRDVTQVERPDPQTKIGPLVRWTVGPLAVVAALLFPFLQEGAEGWRLLVNVALETLFVRTALVTIPPAPVRCA